MSTVVFALSLACVTVGLGLACNFEECDWIVRQGFKVTNASLVNQTGSLAGYDLDGLQTHTGSFALLDGGESPRGRIKSPWVDDWGPITGHVCLSLVLYVGGTEGPKGQITVSTNSNGPKADTSLQLKDLPFATWEEVTFSPLSMTGQFRVVLDIRLERDDVFVAIDNLTLQDCDQKHKEAQHLSHLAEQQDTCKTRDDVFRCSESECIPQSHVCNLDSDCSTDQLDEADHICGELPSWSSCTFEGGTCGWHNGKRTHGDIVLDWKPSNGPDSRLSDQGYYMYVDSSDGDALHGAVLESAIFPPAPPQYTNKSSPSYGNCKVRFFYLMQGRFVLALELWMLDPCSQGDGTLLWVVKGEQGNSWHYGEISINASSRYMLKFEGRLGLGNWCDIAIDDISFSPECFGFEVNFTGLYRSYNVDDIISAEEFSNNTDKYCETETTAKSRYDEVNTVPGRAPHTLDIGYIIAIVAIAIVLSVAMGTILLCVAFRRRKERQLQSAHLEMMSNASEENCVSVPAQPSGFDMQMRCTVTEMNPNYDFIAAKFPDHQLREIPRDKLSFVRQLGQGAFGEVYEGRLKNMCANVTELPVAVKTLPALSTEQAEMDFLMEAVIIGKFMHKNIVKCLGVCFEEHPRYIILELLKGGDLKTFLRDSRPKRNTPCPLTMEELLKLAKDVASGCLHLEEKHFVHRDVAARNCLLTSRTSERVAKIADFGMSRDIYSADYYRKGGKAMLPIKWMPPEAFLDGVFTTKTDVWSFGVLLWEIFTLGYMPYPGQTNSDVMHSVAGGGRLDPPQNCPPRLNKIMIMCWNSVADIRPSFSEIIEHLDMCLQDPEVMEIDMSLAHVPIADAYRDAATLAKPNVVDTPPSGVSPDTLPAESSAQFSRHVESESREPLLLEPEEEAGDS